MANEPDQAVDPAAESSPPVAVLLSITLCFLTLFAFSYLRFRTFKAHIHDLGLISQTLWSTLAGRPFANSINPEIGYSTSYLGNHFSPGLAAWLPLYAVWTSPVALLFIQTLVLALGGWTFYRLTRELVDRPTATALTALYLIQPALWFAGLYDFHHETACATLGLVAWLFHRRGRPVAMVLVLAFMASLKEHVPLLTAMFGVYLAVWGGRRRLGLGIAAASLAYFALVMGVFIPYFNDTTAHSYFERRYPHLGHSAREALVTCLTRPFEVLGFMTTPRHILYLVGLLAPWTFLPLLAPELLLVPLPILFINMQSRVEVTYDIAFYHADTCVPWIAIAAVVGYSRVPRLMPRLARRLGRLLPFLLVLSGAFWHLSIQSAYLPDVRLPLSPGVDRLDYLPTAHQLRIDEIARLVPSDKTLSVQADLACFFTSRSGLYPFPHRMKDADLVLVDLTEPYGHRARHRLFWLEYSLQAKAAAYCAAVREMLSDRTARLVFADDGYLLFARRSPGPEADRAAAIELLERRCRQWTSWTGRGYGR